MSDHWMDYADFPVADWQYEVNNGDTRLGYSEWRAAKIQAAEIDDPLNWRTFEIRDWTNSGDDENDDRVSAAFYLRIPNANGGWAILPMHIEGWAVAPEVEDTFQTTVDGWTDEYDHLFSLAGGESAGEPFHTVHINGRDYIVAAFPFFN